MKMMWLIDCKLAAAGANVALTDAAALNVIVHVPVPEQLPEFVDHPPKLKPAFGVAVSVTVVPALKLALHVVPQLIPIGVLVMVPPPEGVWATVSVN